MILDLILYIYRYEILQIFFIARFAELNCWAVHDKNHDQASSFFKVLIQNPYNHIIAVSVCLFCFIFFYFFGGGGRDFCFNAFLFLVYFCNKFFWFFIADNVIHVYTYVKNRKFSQFLACAKGKT